MSKYRGVTKNKKKWQAYIWVNNKNMYLGSYINEKIAAKIYDVMAIKNKGTKAKTNFKYNIEQINEINKIDFDINNIYEVVCKNKYLEKIII